MAEHSPAPFTAVHSWDAFIYIEDAEGRSVAAMQRRGPNAVANALLFESAPDLLAALDQIVHLAVKDRVTTADAAIGIAGVALAKARGATTDA